MGAGYGAYSLLLSRGFVKPRRAARKVEARKAVNQDDWLKGTYYNKVLCCPSLHAPRQTACQAAAPLMALARPATQGYAAALHWTTHHPLAYCDATGVRPNQVLCHLHPSLLTPGIDALVHIGAGCEEACREAEACGCQGRASCCGNRSAGTYNSNSTTCCGKEGQVKVSERANGGLRAGLGGQELAHVVERLTCVLAQRAWVAGNLGPACW